MSKIVMLIMIQIESVIFLSEYITRIPLYTHTH